MRKVEVPKCVFWKLGKKHLKLFSQVAVISRELFSGIDSEKFSPGQAMKGGSPMPTASY